MAARRGGGKMKTADTIHRFNHFRGIKSISLVDGSNEVEDVHALQILLQSIRTLAEKGL
jgi:hypothetical protein